LQGHSAGGIIAANMAASSAVGLPEPKAIMCVEPGVTDALELEDLSKIPESTLLLCVTGDRDDVVIDAAAIRIFEESSRIADKDFVIVVSDDHGVPSLIADHYAPAAVGKDHSLQDQDHFSFADAHIKDTQTDSWNPHHHQASW